MIKRLLPASIPSLQKRNEWKKKAITPGIPRCDAHDATVPTIPTAHGTHGTHDTHDTHDTQSHGIRVFGRFSSTATLRYPATPFARSPARSTARYPQLDDSGGGGTARHCSATSVDAIQLGCTTTRYIRCGAPVVGTDDGQAGGLFLLSNPIQLLLRIEVEQYYVVIQGESGVSDRYSVQFATQDSRTRSGTISILKHPPSLSINPRQSTNQSINQSSSQSTRHRHPIRAIETGTIGVRNLGRPAS